MSILQQIFRDLKQGENITWLAIILLLIITLILNGLGLMSDTLVTSITIAMLGLLATGVLMIKYRAEEILNQGKLYDTANTVQLLDRYPLLLDDYLRNSNEIMMLGLILRKTTYAFYDEFVERVKSGLKIHGLLVNPYSPTVDMALITRRFSRRDPPELFRSEYEAVLERYTNLRDIAVRADNIQIGLIEFTPPFGLYIFPREKDGGVIFVQIYAHRAPIGATPRFVITERQNPIWYKRFYELYEIMWQDAANYFPGSDY